MPAYELVCQGLWYATWFLQVIFISTVIGRNKRLNSEIGRAQNAGLMGNAKRFNVALTRAKAMLVVRT